MRAKHGYRFISKIPKENAEILHEIWIEHANKRKPGRKDRAKNIRYNIKEIGTVVLSLANGSITMDTDLNEEELKKVIKNHLGKEGFKIFCDNLRCTNVGAHFTKGHGTARYALIVNKPGIFPFSLSFRKANKYSDFHAHFRISKGDGTVKDYSKELYSDNATAPPKRKYLSDVQILDAIKEITNKKQSITSKQLARKLGVDQSTAHRRLKKLEKIDKVDRIGDNPVIYVLS